MKNFDKWNKKKKQVENKQRIEYSDGDILMVNFGENIGVEEGGKGEEFLRPLVVIKKFNKDFALCIPLSTTKKTGIYYHQFNFKDSISNALLSQVKAVDAKRFKYRMGNINSEILNELKTKTRNLIS